MTESILSKVRFVTLATSVAALPFSIVVCHLALGAFLLLTLFEGNFSKKLGVIFRNPVIWLPMAWFGLHLLGVLYSQNSAAGWAQVEKKVGFLLAPMLIGSAIAFSKKEIDALATVFISACIIGTFVCFAHALTTADASTPSWNFGPSKPFQDLHPEASNLWPYFTYVGLASGIGIHPTYFAFYLLFCLLLVMERGLLRHDINKILMFALIGYLFAVITLLSSRIVVFLSIASLVFIAIHIQQRHAYRWALVGCFLVGAVALLWLNPIATYRNTQEYTASNFQWPPASMADNPINIRVSLWWLTSQAIPTVNPLFGVGPGDVKDYIQLFADNLNVHNKLNTYDPHNQFAFTYLGMGLFGLIVLIGIFISLLRVLARARLWVGVFGLAAWICVCLTESALESQKGIVLFVLFASLAANQLRTGPDGWVNKFTTKMAALHKRTERLVS